MAQRFPFFILRPTLLLALALFSLSHAFSQPFSYLQSRSESALLLPMQQHSAAHWRLLFQAPQPYRLAVYQLEYAGYPVPGATLAVGSAGSHRLLSGFLPEWPFESTSPTTPGSKFWVADSSTGKYVLCRADTALGSLTFYHHTGQQQVLVQPMLRYFHADTSIKARVFQPDPISSSFTVYGQVFKDRGDSAFASPQAQLFSVWVPVRRQADSFTLYHPKILFSEISNPVTPHAVTTDSFAYLRSDAQFEEVNVFYHLVTLQDWWHSLGFANWCDTVQVDVHAYEGADESAFNPLAQPPSIEFGDGGVDDAEDADAAVHEYTHAASHAVNPGAYAGTQRQAVEEGICDFMAVCYSHRYSQYQPSWVYQWDGHNEFWAGRDLDNSRVYPGSLTNQTHIDGQLFGAALYSLAKEIGDDSAVALTLATLPFLSKGISMPAAASLFLMVDSLWFGARFHWPLVKAFFPRGLLPQVAVETLSAQGTLWVLNSADFAKGEPVQVFAPAAGHWVLTDAQGRVLMQGTCSEGELFSIDPAELASAVYVLRVGRFACQLLR